MGIKDTHRKCFKVYLISDRDPLNVADWRRLMARCTESG